MIYRSPYPEIPVPPVSLPELILGRAGDRGSHPALVDGLTGAVTTYSELAGAVERTAAGLHALGLRHGEVAAICAPNCVEFPVALLAAARLGKILRRVLVERERDLSDR